jgi:glycosyltransferase involved in cell wall biosynthesis
MLDRRSVLRRINEFFVRRLGGAIVLGECHHDVFRNALPERKIHIVPNFAEDYLFIDANRIDGKFAETSPLRFLFLSNLLPGKGHLELVEAFFATDASTRERIAIDFAGAFESEQQKAAFLNAIGKSRQLQYHGVVSGDRKKSLFHQAHVFCLPTYYPYEGQPISILEAYASGCAVITTDHSGISDVFADGVNGHLVAARSADDLRHAMVLALADVQRLREMALANRRKADAEFRTSTYNHNLLRVIKSVRNSRPQQTGYR